MLQIGYDADHNELFRATGTFVLSLAWKQSERIVAAGMGLNVIVVLLSMVALLAIIKRRFELFSSVSLFLFSIASLAISALQIACVILMQQNVNGDYGSANEIGGVVVVEILG